MSARRQSLVVLALLFLVGCGDPELNITPPPSGDASTLCPDGQVFNGAPCQTANLCCNEQLLDDQTRLCACISGRFWCPGRNLRQAPVGSDRDCACRRLASFPELDTLYYQCGTNDR